MAEQGGRNRTDFKSLASLLRYFEDTQLKVELKTGRVIEGILVSSDANMNITLDDARIIEPPSATLTTTTLSTIHIRGSTIRFLHFPVSLDLPATIKQGIDRERAAREKYKRGLRK